MIEVVGDLSPENIGELQRYPAEPSEHAQQDHSRNPVIITEEGAELERVVLSMADRRLIEVYGDHIHHNNSCHMERGITDNISWDIGTAPLKAKWADSSSNILQRNSGE